MDRHQLLRYIEGWTFALPIDSYFHFTFFFLLFVCNEKTIKKQKDCMRMYTNKRSFQRKKNARVTKNLGTSLFATDQLYHACTIQLLKNVNNKRISTSYS